MVGQWVTARQTSIYKGCVGFVVEEDGEQIKIHFTISRLGNPLDMQKWSHKANWELYTVDLTEQDRHDMRVLAVDINNKSLFE